MAPLSDVGVSDLESRVELEVVGGDKLLDGSQSTV